MDDVVKAGMADLNMAKSPQKIRTSGLGSCVGLVIYEEKSKLCGMAHVMLPDSSMAKNTTLNKAKYADTAIQELVDRLKQNGANVSMLKAKLAGGAQMFKFSVTSDMMRIGPRNVEAVKQKLNELNIKIIAEDVGGSSGRTVEFNPETCCFEIRTVNQGVSTI